MKYLNQVLEYFDVSDKYRSYQIQLLIKYVGKNILEVGAGIGSFTKNYINNTKNITLTDLDTYNYDILKKNFRLRCQYFSKNCGQN